MNASNNLETRVILLEKEVQKLLLRIASLENFKKANLNQEGALESETPLFERCESPGFEDDSEYDLIAINGLERETKQPFRLT